MSKAKQVRLLWKGECKTLLIEKQKKTERLNVVRNYLREMKCQRCCCLCPLGQDRKTVRTESGDDDRLTVSRLK